MDKLKWQSDRQDQLIKMLGNDPFNQNSLIEFGLNGSDASMLHYSYKLTRTPGSVNIDDIGELRQQGFADRAIHDIACIVSYFAFVNRVADGLGVQLEN